MKTKRNLIKACLLVVLIALPAVVQAQYQYTDGDGNTYYYMINNNTITITNFNGISDAVTIPNEILVNSANLPVTGIGDNAFSGSSLISVTIPSSVITIGTNAFDGVPLTSVTIGTNVTSIGFQAFGGTQLTSVTIPSSVTNIGDAAFSECTSLATITVNAGNPDYSNVGGVLFNKSKTSLIQCPGAQSGSYTIPTGVTNIEELAFAGCSQLTSIAISSGVISIGDDAFAGCGLTTVTVPSSVTSIGTGAFLGGSLSTITVNVSNPDYSSVGGVLFNKGQTMLIEYPQGLSGSYTIFNGVTSIGNAAFAGCFRLTSVTIPGSVTNIGVFAFVQSGLTNVTISNGVASIGMGAFEYAPLTSVTIPGSVTNIGEGSFEACNLTKATIGRGVISIGDYGFAFCASLTGAYFQGNAPSADCTVFESDPATIYYSPITTGWGQTFACLPTALEFIPNPVILNNGPGFGVQSNRFGFTIAWATNIPVVVEACTNLANLIWTPVATNTLTNGSSYFSDTKWTNYPRRYYRLSAP